MPRMPPHKNRALPLVRAIYELIDQHKRTGGNPFLKDPQAESEIKSVTSARLSTSIIAR